MRYNCDTAHHSIVVKIKAIAKKLINKNSIVSYDKNPTNWHLYYSFLNDSVLNFFDLFHEHFTSDALSRIN